MAPGNIPGPDRVDAGMTTPALSRLPVSMLDRANSLAGSTEAEALNAVVERAQRAERLGFTRFWVAEHHGVPGRDWPPPHGPA